MKKKKYSEAPSETVQRIKTLIFKNSIAVIDNLGVDKKDIKQVLTEVIEDIDYYLQEI